MAESDVEASIGLVPGFIEEERIRVLLVDDEAGFLKAARQILEMEGPFEVETVESVEEAFENMGKKEFDVVVSDYKMPGTDGLQFLKELRQKGNRIPFIMFTGKGREEVAVKALNLGADRYLNKTGDPEAVYGELAHSIRQVVQSRRAEERVKRSEEKYRSLFENAKDVIVLLDLKGNVTDINKGAVEYGFKKEEFIGKNMRKFVPKKYWPRLLKELVQLSRGKTIENEIEIITPKGKRLAGYRSNPIIIDNKVVGVQVILKDITERTQMEEKLRESEEKLKNILTCSPDAIIISDLEGKVSDCNKAALELTGFSSKEELVGRSSYQFIAEKDRERAAENLKRTLEQGTTKNIEYTLLRKNGEEYPGELSASILRDCSGKPIGFVGILRDVTERKRWEEEVRIKDAALASSINAVALADLQGNLTYVNRAFLNLWRCKDQSEVLGRPCTEFWQSEEVAEEVIKAVPNQGGWTGELIAKRKDGTSFDALLSASMVKDKTGNPVCMMASFIDITDQKKREEKLRESEGKLNAMLQSIGDHMSMMDEDLNILWANETAKKIFGDDIIGKKCYRVYHGREKPCEPYPCLTLKAFQDGKVHEHDTQVTDKEGKTIYFHCTANVALKDAEGKPKAVLEISRDVTEKKKARQKIEAEKQKLETYFKSMADGISVTDEKGTIIRLNEAAAKMYGFKSPTEMIGKKIFQFVAKRDLPRVKRRYLEAVNDKNLIIRNLEITARRNDGSEFPVLISSANLLDGEGNIVGNIGIIKDITERKRVEEELRSSRNRLRILFQYAPDAYYLNDLKGNFVDGNKAAEELTGYKKSELIGKNFLKLNLLSRSQMSKAAKLLAKNALGKPTGPDEFVLNRKDGTQVPVEIRTYPVKIKDRLMILGIARDITERKKRERVIRESQEKFRRLFVDSPEAGVYVDRDFRVLDINPRFTELFGYKLKEVEGKPINDVVVPEDKREEAERLNRKVAKEKPARLNTVRRKKDGSLIPVSVSASRITAGDRFLGYISLYTDISELKEKEEELERLNEKLEVVGKLTRHDVRNKLSAVTSNAYLTKKKLSDGHEALQYLKEIESAVEQAVRIFDFARTYEKLGTKELEYVDVAESVEKAVQQFSDLKGAEVVNECGGLTVLADSLLTRLFYNLIHNSLEHGGEVNQIRVYYREAGNDHVELVYEDDGVGIPDGEKEKIFQEGYGKGSGYGLYLIRKMCEVYGWTIRETGKQGKGAQFTITIPKMNESGKKGY